MKPKPTLKHISQSLKLSISTVSRALKNHPDISIETRTKVRELAAMLDYEPNPYAINLRTNSSRVFGLIVPIISNYFYYSFIASMEEETRRLGYSLLVLQSGDDPDTELENLRLCKFNRVAGVFVCLSKGTKDIRPFLKMEEDDIPVIFFDKVPSYEACNKVCMADLEAGAIAAMTILQKKKQNILAIFGNPELSITQKRQQSFSDTLSAASGKLKYTMKNANSPEEARLITTQHCSKKPIPDTIFAMSDEILTGVMKALLLLNLKVPDNIAVISICNNNFIPSLFLPEITYVETSGYDLGKLSIKRMMDLLSGKTFKQEISVPSKLVPGGSI